MLFASGIFVLGYIISICFGSKCGDAEGAWSIGLYYGNNPFNFTTEIPHSNTRIQNPILYCNSITDVTASFVADPFLFFPNGTNNEWYLFFEVKNTDIRLTKAHGQIGAAVSYNKVCLY